MRAAADGILEAQMIAKHGLERAVPRTRTAAAGPSAAAAVIGALAVLAALATAPASRAADGSDLYDPALVRAYDFTFESPDWQSALQSAGDLGNARADLELDGELLADVGVRYKGLSSMLVWSQKKPLNVKTDVFVPGQRALGYDAINLNNGYSDPSFVREALMTEMLRPYMPTQQTAFARVSINGSYLGLYLAVEQVEGTFVDHWFPGSDGILIKADPQAGPGMGATTFHSSLEWEGEDLAKYDALYEVKTDGQEQAGLTIVREAARVLDAPRSAGGVRDADLPAAVTQVLDVDGALWHLAADNLFVNYDSYYFGHNYFLYHSDDDDLLHMLIWDTSLSFGGLELGEWGSDGAGTRVEPYALDDADERPVLRRLLAVPEWRADFAAHYRVLLANAFDPQALERRGAELQALVRPTLVDDPNRLFSLDLFDRNLREDVTSRMNMGPGGRSPGVVKFARERSQWLRGLPELAPPDHRLVEHVRQPGRPEADEPARVVLRFAGNDAPTAVRLMYRAARGRPQSVELAGSGDTWQGTIPGLPASTKVTYYARVSLPGNRSAFHPEANLTQPWAYTVLPPDLPVIAGGDLVINELQADNAATVADQSGEYDDWLELRNRGSVAVDLSAYYLGASAESPWRYRLPEVSLAPGARYLVWCDRDPEQGPDHADFKLGRGGDEVRLSTADATFDVVSFPALATDVSWARLPDGYGSWLVCDSPTPGEANRCSGSPPATATDLPSSTATATAFSPPLPSSTHSPSQPPPSGHPVYLPALRSD